MNTATIERILKVFLFIVVIGLLYWLYVIIREPIIENRKSKIRKAAVVERMKLIRKSQNAYKARRGHFSGNWDSLLDVVKFDSFNLVKTTGDPNDTTIKTRRDTTYVAIKDSILPKQYPVDSLPYAPYSGGKKFKLDADVIKQRGVKVHIFRVKDVKPIGKSGKVLQLGSLKEAKYSGNWK